MTDTIKFVLIIVIAQLVLRPLLAPLFRGMARLYRPPHGARVLALTWVVALAATFLSFRFASRYPDLGTILVIVSIPAALLATMEYRDSRRASLGLPPANELPPGNQVPMWAKLLLGYKDRDPL